MKKAVAYYRKSIEKDATKSIANQKEVVHLYAVENRIEIVSEYEEVASSATLKRDEFQRMFQDLTDRNDIDFILVHRFDRITREIDGFGWILAQLKDILSVKTRLHSVTENNDYGDDPSKLLMRVFETYGATIERNNSVERMQAARRRKKATGGFIGGTPPMGYKAVMGTGNLTIQEKEVSIVRDALRYRSEGLSMSEIAEELNKKGYKTRKNKSFYAMTVQRILKYEEWYLGKGQVPGIYK
ncbi:recombinase family protein [Sporosarcina koreensis]|uniref:Recombinase family protein n=1 Tax=Sporosarcina koreensis TaxID=334735 RepID=A0ABW0TTV2_9BACL